MENTSLVYRSWIAYYTIVRKELVRIFRIWTQTFLPHVTTQTLYFVIFGEFIGKRIGEFQGISYMAFIVPGLVMLAVVNSSFGNVVSSFFSSKFQRNIEELLVAPVTHWVIIAGYVTGGVVRGVIVGILVLLVSLVFVKPQVVHPFIVIVFMLLSSLTFSLGGLMNAIFAKKFDDIALVPNFVLIPLTYLGGVFYSIESLPPFWQVVSKFNPIFYLVNGFRYGFYGVSDVPLNSCLIILISLVLILLCVNVYLIKKGVSLKS